MTKYRVWRPDQDEAFEDGRLIDAWDANRAVCSWAEWKDSSSAEYSIVGGNDETVMVRAVNGPIVEYEFIVSGESVPSYTARLKVKGPNP